MDEVATTQLRPISAVAEVGVKAKLNKKEEQKKKKEKLEKRKQKLAELEAQQEAEKKKWQVRVPLLSMICLYCVGMWQRIRSQ